MTAAVPNSPLLPDRAEIVVAAPVRTVVTRAEAQLANYLLGHGATLVPYYAPMSGIAKGVAKTFRFKVQPQYQTLVRLWVLRVVREPGLDTDSTIRVKTPSTGSAVTYSVERTSRSRVTPILHLEYLTTQSSSATDISVEITNDGDVTDCVVEGIGVYALPRAALLSNTNENGVDIGALLPALPIFDAPNGSFGGVVDAIAAVPGVARRCGLLGWAVDSSSDARVLSNGQRLFVDGDGPIMLGRYLYSGDTVRAVTVYAYCKTSTAATAGDLTLEMTSGDVQAITVPINSDAAFAWYSHTINIDAEDLSAADGRRSSNDDHIDAVFNRTAGAGTLSVAALCVGEAAF